MNLRAVILAPLALVAVSTTTMAVAAPAPAAKAPAMSTAIIPVPLNPVIAPAQRMCAARTASGLGTATLRAAQGARPAKADYVLVGYIGYIAASGEVFDQNPGTAFPVEGVIPGFSEGLQLMEKGSVWRFCVPSALGYGAQGAGSIPANADLVFQVELLDFKTAAEVQAMQSQAQSAPSAGGEATPAPTPPPAAPPSSR